MTTREVHYIDSSRDPADTCDWINACGYDAVIVGYRPGGAAQVGVAFSRLNEPMRMAVTRQTLVWDGRELTVEEP